MPRSLYMIAGSVIAMLTPIVRVEAQLYTVDPPGSIGTFPVSINKTGTITGFYSDGTNVSHGFVRDVQGTPPATFDPPGSIGTYAQSINATGTIIGYYSDSASVSHGFIRNVQGNLTTFDPPGSIGTYAQSINATGTIIGYYFDSANVTHGFIRDVQGNFTTFDPPGSIGTFPVINETGVITGYYLVSANIQRGFVRDVQGNFNTFDPPGSVHTYPASINATGTISGFYSDSTFFSHSFVRDVQGNITTFDPPGTTSLTNLLGSVANHINETGTITGFYQDNAAVTHGFVRDVQGNFTTFDPPGSVGVFGTEPGSINATGTVTGNYTDSAGVRHGFIGKVPNGIDISRSAGNVSDATWKNIAAAGVSFVVVDAWGGLAKGVLTQDQLVGDGTATHHGAQGNGLTTGAYVLLNYFKQESAQYQVNQAIQAVGTGINKLKLMVVDVEVCCGEFVSWKPSTGYKVGAVVMDGANHIQKVITSGTSGITVPIWNDTGGTTPDGTVTWDDTRAVVMKLPSRIAQISAAVAYIKQQGLNVALYTNKSQWAAITGNCDNGTTNNCSALMSLPLWDVEYKTFLGGDGVYHCGDGIADLVPFTQYSPLSWPNRSGNQYDFGLSKATCGNDGDFGLPAVDLDYFDPALFK